MQAVNRTEKRDIIDARVKCSRLKLTLYLALASSYEGVSLSSRFCEKTSFVGIIAGMNVETEETGTAV